MESTPCVGNTALVINLLGQCKLKQRHGHNFSVLLNADDSSHGRHRLRGTQRQFLENVCSEDELRARIFGAFVVKFLACLSPPPQNGIIAHFKKKKKEKKVT